MNKFTHLFGFVQYLFDEERTAWKAKLILEGLLKARSPRLSDIAREMAGQEEKNYKCIQRFLKSTARDLAASVPGSSYLRDWRSNRNAQTASQEDRLCGNLE